MDTNEYRDEIESELTDNTTYKQIDENMVVKIENKIKRTVEDMCKRIPELKEMKSYFLPKDTRPGRVQGNPKMHKQKRPLRVIINGQHTATENIAEFIENELSENVKNLASYIKDTTDFLNKIKMINQPLPPDTIMFCLDVKALYPSVPRDEAKIACKDALDKRTNPKIPTNDVLKLMDLVLQNNIFSFNGRTYIQTEGTAIGSRLGMNYACTYMDEWEKELFERSELLPIQYWRFVDDVWGLWTHGEDTLDTFVDTANTIHPRIQVELRSSKNSIEFLDVKTIIDNGYIKTDLFTKDTDKHQYLHISSNHPKNVKDSIPFGLGIRLKRIGSETSDYEKRKKELHGHLRKRGYKSKSIVKQFDKVDELTREDLLKYNQPKQNERVPLVMTYSDALPNIHAILHKHMNILHRSEDLTEIFPAPPIVAFRRDKNLKEILIHKKHNNLFYKRGNGCEPCGKNCALCKRIIQDDKFYGTDGTEYKIQGSINCKTANLIYAIRCRKCEKTVYVGQTGDTFYQRMLLNFSMIRTKKHETVAEHFNSKGHSVDDFQVIGIEKIFGEETYRLVKETFWIKKLKTFPPHGLNIKVDN